MTTLDQRLQAIQKRLEDKGVRDFKFTLDPTYGVPSAERVKHDLVVMLEAYLDGKCEPLPLADVDPPDTHPV